MKSLMIAGAAALWMVTACPVSLAADTDSNTLMIKDFKFTPMDFSVKAGTKVTWTNQDDEPHTIASIDGVFRSAALDTNESFSFKFDKPGTYKYVCSIHPRMVGTITVQ